MTINIRSNVFETNSSSSHSISLSFPFNDALLKPLIPNKKGQIVLNGGDFASIEFDVSSVQDKLNLMAVYLTVYDNKELKERFEKVVKEHSGASEIVYNIRMSASNGENANSFFSPQITNAYLYNPDYDDESDEDNINYYSEIYLEDIMGKEDLLRTFLFSNSASITSEISYS